MAYRADGVETVSHADTLWEHFCCMGLRDAYTETHHSHNKTLNIPKQQQ